MAAAPQSGTFTFVGYSGQRYSVDAYLSDVANALANFDSGVGASATSENFWTCPEACIMVDYSQFTGLTDTTKIQIGRNGVSTGRTLRFAMHLSTLNSRPQLAIPFNAGDRVSGVQLA